MSDGWIKLYRAVLENPRFEKDNDYFVVWVKLLLMVTHKPRKALFNGKSIMIQPGQIVTSRAALVKACNVNRSKLERILDWLESEQQIEQQTCTTSRCITITNWQKYQQIEQPNEQQVSSDRAATEQRVSTYKNERKKEEKNLNTIRGGVLSTPTREEVVFYFEKNNATSDQGLRFFNNYQASGWRRGGDLIADWQALASNWITKDRVQPDIKPQAPVERDPYAHYPVIRISAEELEASSYHRQAGQA